VFLKELDQNLFLKKHPPIRDRTTSVQLHLEILDRSKNETAELKTKVLELSQTLKEMAYCQMRLNCATKPDKRPIQAQKKTHKPVWFMGL
jgi:hypothetical protein